MLELTCNSEQKIKVTAAPLTTTGRAARVDGALAITVQTGSGTFAQIPTEPLSFYAISGDDPGETTYLVEADADLGSGVTLLADTVVLTVEGALAASFGLTSGQPEPK